MTYASNFFIGTLALALNTLMSLKLLVFGDFLNFD